MHSLQFLLVELHNVCPLHESIHQCRRIAARPEVQVIELHGFVQPGQEPFQYRFALMGRGKQRPVIKPSRGLATEAFDIAIGNPDGVIGRGTWDVEVRLASRDEFDGGGSRWKRGGKLKKGRIDLKCGDPLGRLPAEFVHANRADQANVMP